MSHRAPGPEGPPPCTHDPPCWEWVTQKRGAWVWINRKLHEWDGIRWQNRSNQT